MNYKEEITNRIAIVLEDIFSGNKSRFAKKIDVDESRIRSYTLKNLNDRSMPPAEFIAAMISNIGINPEWLLLGEGEMLKRYEDNTLPQLNYTRPLTIDYSEFASMCKTIQSQQETINLLAKEKNGTAGAV